MPKKSDRRKLAELISRQKNIKLKSAMRYLQRIEAPEGKQRIKAPRYSGLSDYARRKVKRSRKKAAPAAAPRQQPEEDFYPGGKVRVKYQEDQTRVVGVKATYDFYGSDRRTRMIRLTMQGEELNNFLNAATPGEALETLTHVKREGYLESASISDLEYFTLEGETHGGEYFDD